MCVLGMEWGTGQRGCDVSGKNILSSCNVVVDLTHLLVITNYCVDVRVSDKS